MDANVDLNNILELVKSNSQVCAECLDISKKTQEKLDSSESKIQNHNESIALLNDRYKTLDTSMKELKDDIKETKQILTNRLSEMEVNITAKLNDIELQPYKKISHYTDKIVVSIVITILTCLVVYMLASAGIQ